MARVETIYRTGRGLYAVRSKDSLYNGIECQIRLGGNQIEQPVLEWREGRSGPAAARLWRNAAREFVKLGPAHGA